MQVKREISGRLMLVAGVAGVLMVASTAQAAPTLRTFGTGDVTATADSATIVNDGGEYGGVYSSSKSKSSKPLAQVVFQFRNDGGDVAGGSPRLSIPIDTDSNGSTDNGYAFLDVAGCGGVTGDNTLVSTQSGTCMVNFQNVSYPNWATFASTFPSYRIAPGYVPFVIADTPGSYAVDGIVLRG